MKLIMSMHGMCFNTGQNGNCVVDENGECSEECPGYENMIDMEDDKKRFKHKQETRRLESNRKKFNKYYFIQKNKILKEKK